MKMSKHRDEVNRPPNSLADKKLSYLTTPSGCGQTHSCDVSSFCRKELKTTTVIYKSSHHWEMKLWPISGQGSIEPPL